MSSNQSLQVPSIPTQSECQAVSVTTDMSRSPKGWSWENDMTSQPPKWLVRLRNDSETIDLRDDLEEQVAPEIIPLRRSTRLRRHRSLMPSSLIFLFY